MCELLVKGGCRTNGEHLLARAMAGAVAAVIWRSSPAELACCSGEDLLEREEELGEARALLEECFPSARAFFDAAGASIGAMLAQAKREGAPGGGLLAQGAVRAATALGASLSLVRSGCPGKGGACQRLLRRLTEEAEDAGCLLDGALGRELAARAPPAACASIAEALQDAGAGDADGDARRILGTCFFAGIVSCWHWIRNRRVVEATGMSWTITHESLMARAG